MEGGFDSGSVAHYPLHGGPGSGAMKVGMLLGSLTRKGGGVFEAVLGLSKSLVHAHGIDVRAFGLYDRHLIQDGRLWQGIPLTTRRYFGPGNLGIAPNLGAALAESALDLLHTHNLWQYQSYTSLRWAIKTGRPVVISPHGALEAWALGRSRWKKLLAATLYENRHLRKAAVLHALNTQELDAIRAYGLRNPVCVIPNGVDIDNTDTPTPAPWSGIIPAGSKVLLYIGRLHAKKNLHSLLNAWAVVEKQASTGADWWLVIVGWDQAGYGDSLRRFASESRLQRAWFAGPRFGAEKASCLQHADAFVLPSLSEGLPMAVLEAWAYHLPVAMTPESNLEDGFTAEAAVPISTDRDGILTGLSSLFRMSDAERRAMGIRGRSLVERDYGWDTISGQMVGVYDWLLGGGPAPSCIIM